MGAWGSCLRFQSFHAENAWLATCRSQNKNVSLPDPACEHYADEELLDVLERLFINRWDTYATQRKDGQYVRVDEPLTREVLRRHLAGEITVGTYQINPSNNMVKWLVFDVDPEHVRDPKQVASTLLRECTSRFHELAVLLEASRHPDPSFHVWTFFEPEVPAKAARWLGRKILENMGIVVELFPKQDTVNLGDFGNLVKLPLGFHRKEKKWSKFLNPATFEPIQANCLTDVVGCSFLEKDLQRIIDLAEKQRGIQVKFSIATQTYKKKRRVRPCLSEALKSRELPHQARLAIAIEYLKTDFDVTEVVNLFGNQVDFDEKKTLYQVSHAKEKAYAPYKCVTIQNMGYCVGTACPIFRKQKQRFETMVNTL